MGDEVGVQPGRLNELASKLEQLRDVLAATVPTIVSTLNEYWSGGQGTPINLSPLQQAQHKSADDAADIRTRSNMAMAWEKKAAADLPGGMIHMPWLFRVGPLNAASAQADAKLLAQAEAESGKDPRAARALIVEVEEDLQHHAGDATFLADFWSQPQAAKAAGALAATLHDEDGGGINVLSAKDTKILSTFASSLALTCSLPPGQGLSAQQSEALVAAFTAASQKNPWSAAMLLASGPDGHAYGTGTGAQVLGSVTASLLNAERAGNFTVPMNWRQLVSSGTNLNGELVNRALARFDPTMTLLKLDTSNQAAAAYTLSTPDGPAIAKQLMTWQFVHYGNLSYDERGGMTAFPDYTGPEGPWDQYQVPWSQQAIGGFLTAAVSAPRGDTTQADWSAEAAVNIVRGLPPATGDDAVTVSPQVQAALTRLMTNFRFDLAVSADDPSLTSTETTHFGSVWGISLTSANEQKLIQQALRNPSAFGTFLAQVRGDIGVAAVIAVKNPGDDMPLTYESALAGLLQRAQNGLHFSTVEQAAAAAAENQEMDSILQGGLGVALGLIPGGGVVQGVVDSAELANALSGPVIGSSLSDSTDPAQALQDGDDAFYDLKSGMWVPIANALIASHLVAPPPAGQDPPTWVAQQLAQNVQQADQAAVDKLQAELATSSPEDRGQIRTQIDKLENQIANAQNLFESLVQQARDGIGGQQ